MAGSQNWKIPAAQRPRLHDYKYDLTELLNSVVSVTAHVPSNAFTAETLGTERGGHGAIIRADGLVLTIGYLVAEAEEIWVTFNDGRVERGHVLSYDQQTGFGLLQLLAHVEARPFVLGDSALATPGDDVVLAGAGGLRHCAKAEVIARQEFAGYWEYVVDEAIFTAPAHPNWGGAALIGKDGELLGIGSLKMEFSPDDGPAQQVNMVVPIDLLKPILTDLLTLGRRNTPPRPWLGLYAADLEGHVVVVGISSRGPAKTADLRVGDVILGVAGEPISDAAQFFKKVWSLGPAGVPAPLLVMRDREVVEMIVASTDRHRFFATPRLH